MDWHRFITVPSLVIAALVLALETALSTAPHVMSSIPFSETIAYFGYAPLVLFVVAGMSWLFGRRGAIVILLPPNDASIGRLALVRGSVRPAGRPVQVLVYGHGSKLWYPQNPRPITTNLYWEANCTFGDAKEGAGSFNIIARDASRSIITENVSALPWSLELRSRVVRVTRLA